MINIVLCSKMWEYVIECLSFHVDNVLTMKLYDLSSKLQKNGFSVWQNVASFENFVDENTGKKYAIMI